ncbi:hypothetical protein GK047_12060 [Paenibacillus sp. SYP-B3998]|uniref:SWIM-type domain-containing protein n=1 Tax=Paenibacillus sp. SYP-B3998 TaxID=2678564 RepID=A0A6G3ZYT9_9BACL|nr:SWIM zinc finger family protein [Paenibacillus sp. SYP-B3998]NEW06749.1 hypothetical protein [Paenibacillus sp. SYP-B3998]
MSASPVLNDAQWLKLLEHVAETYSEVTLNRGFNYFKQQRIATLLISENRVVQALVQGSEDYRVTLNLDKLSTGYCACPVHSSCKHLAAVMMELADRLGYPASQIVNAKHHLKRATSIISLESQFMQLPQNDVSGWQDFLDQYASQIKPAYDPANYIEMLRNQLQNFKKASISFTEIDQVIFEFHQQLFILRKLKEQHAQGGINYYTSSFEYRIFDEILAWLKQQSPAASLIISSDRLQQTLSYLRKQMAGESGQKYQYYHIYTALWKNWLAPQHAFDHWLEQEIQALETMAEDRLSSSLSAAMAFMYLQQSRSKEAWEALEANHLLKEAPTNLLIPFLNHLQDTLNWVELTYWLRRTSSFFYRKPFKDLEIYVTFWKEVIKHFPQSEEQMWTVLEELLPHSSRVIEELLYEQKKWKLWLEMQILHGHDPFHHRVSVLQPIEKESPRLLLPYYHQAIDHYVSLKNRHDYKSAVKLLKRLEKVYKKMKQAEHWDRFISDFKERYSRLRALQEELRKGKLLE